jgi:hypothetical protein
VLHLIIRRWAPALVTVVCVDTIVLVTVTNIRSYGYGDTYTLLPVVSRGAPARVAVVCVNTTVLETVTIFSLLWT